MSIKVSASILAADMSKLGEEIRDVTEAGADLIHVDVLDGHFAPNISFGANAVEVARRFSNLPIEVHLMVLDDLFLTNHLIPAVAKHGADTIIVHAERCLHLDRILNHIRSYDKKAGIALNPSTPLEVLKHIDVDHVLVMSVNPGFSGQKFIGHAVQRIEECRSIIGERNIELSVDGGIDKNNARLVKLAGVDIMVAGSSIFGANLKEAVSALKNA